MLVNDKEEIYLKHLSIQSCVKSLKKGIYSELEENRAAQSAKVAEKLRESKWAQFKTKHGLKI